MIKLDIKTIIITASILLVGIVGGFVFFKNTPQPIEPEPTLSATGSRFVMPTEWVVASTTGDGATIEGIAVASSSPVFVATTTTIFIAAGASTTVDIVTAGVADIRFNLQANSTTTSPTLIAVQRDVIARNGIDVFPTATITDGTVSDTPYPVWFAATTSDSTLIDTDIPKTSILFENIDTPKTQFTFGADTDVDLFIEVVKAVPN